MAFAKLPKFECHVEVILTTFRERFGLRIAWGCNYKAQEERMR